MITEKNKTRHMRVNTISFIDLNQFHTKTPVKND
jgi:hypothetical protein